MWVTEERVGAVTILALNNPSMRNAMGQEMRGELLHALLKADSDREVRAIVVTGAGEHFCSGGDVTSMHAVADLTAGRERVRKAHELVRALVGISKPVVAAVEGWAAGGGMSIALLADTVVASQSAKFAASFGKLGLVADLGLLYSLPRRVGEARARQILLFAETVTGSAALEMGLVDELTATGSALVRAIEQAEVLAASAPLPMAYTKQLLNRGMQEVLDWERDAQAALFLSADHVEGRDAFIDKRVPIFRGM